jgi:hypothetical protein
MDRFDVMFELLQNVDKKQDKQLTELESVKVELDHHIERTDKLEKHIYGTITWKQLATGVGILGGLVGIVFKLREVIL